MIIIQLFGKVVPITAGMLQI